MKHILSRVISIFTFFFMANWCHAEGTWILVTDVSDLQTGDKVIIVAKDYDRAMGKSASGATYQPSVDVTLDGETCIVNDEVQILDVTSNTDDSFYLKIGDKYLCADKDISNNNLYVGIQSKGYANWNITIVDGVTRIKAVGSGYKPLIQYYGPNRHFGCYLSEGKDKYHVSLYKFVEEQGGDKDPAEIILVDAGNQSSDTIKTYIGSSNTLPATASKVEGLEFVGWSSGPIVAGTPIAIGSIFSPGSSVKVEENLIFYAVYAKAVYSGEPAYVKVEGNQTDWSGTYLIACEGMGKVFNGSLGKESLFAMDKSNAVGAEISENKIAWNEETELYEFRIDKYDGGYSIKSKSGYYIGCKTTSENIAQLAEYLNKITFDNSQLNIKSSGYWLFYNKSTSRFLYTGSTHERVQLYKRTDVTKSYAFYTTSISIDVPINKYGYATWYAGMPVKVPDGLNAFTCQVEGNTAMLHAVGTVIPAHTGVVLYAAEAVGKGQNVVLPYANVDTTPIASNALIGFVEDTEVDNGKAHYALNVKNNVVGFYIPQTTTDPVLSATSAFTAIAGKAYLELDAQMSISALELKRIDDVSVNQISTSSIDIIYDLMGRKVSSPSKGIYVVNGRKMVLTGEEYKTK